MVELIDKVFTDNVFVVIISVVMLQVIIVINLAFIVAVKYLIRKLFKGE